MTNPPPVCAECGCAFRKQALGRLLTFLAEDGRPYYVASGDEWECPSCNRRIFDSYGTPIFSHDRHFKQALAQSHMSIKL